jgi:hypothetical protein
MRLGERTRGPGKKGSGSWIMRSVRTRGRLLRVSLDLAYQDSK